MSNPFKEGPVVGTPDSPNYAWPLALAWRYPFQTTAVVALVLSIIALVRT